MLLRLTSLRQTNSHLASAFPGASGFLGTELTAQLLEHKSMFRVRATVRNVLDDKRTKPLLALPNAQDRLELVQADLLTPGSFDECVKGAKFVFHTASPFVTAGIKDPQAELVDPALKGTINVFQSIVKSIKTGSPKPQRVVLTSSVAAVMGGVKDKDGCFDEDDWNESSSLDSESQLDWYRLSKKLAEKMAWQMSASLGLDLATINPSFIVGPPRTPRRDGTVVQLHLIVPV